MIQISEEAYMVAFDIQEGGSGYVQALTTKLGAKEEVSIGASEFEGKGASSGTNATKSGLQAQGIKGNVAICKLVEVKAGSAAEAVEVVRQKYASNAGGERTVVKPNETNFQVIL